MERMAVLILFLIFSLAAVGPATAPPNQGTRPEAKVTTPVPATVNKVTLQAKPIRRAGEDPVNEDHARQG